jgi:hypothetical protein
MRNANSRRLEVRADAHLAFLSHTREGVDVNLDPTSVPDGLRVGNPVSPPRAEPLSRQFVIATEIHITLHSHPRPD